MTLPHVEREGLRKLATMKAANACEWELNEAVGERVYRLYVHEERSMQAAVYAAQLDEQEQRFQADADQRRCQAAWARFGTAGGDVRGILHAARTVEAADSADVAPGVRVTVTDEGEDVRRGD